MGGAILGIGSFIGRTSCDENSQLCALMNTFTSFSNLLTLKTYRKKLALAQEGSWTAALKSSLHLRGVWSQSRAFSAARHQMDKQTLRDTD